MPRSYRHPTLGKYHKLDLRGVSGMTHVPDAALAGLIRYLNSAETLKDKKIVQILEKMLELEKIEQPVWNLRVDFPISVMRNGRMTPNPRLKKIEPEKYQRQLEVDEKELSINRELAQYRFLPSVSPPPWSKDLHWSKGLHWFVIWQIQPRKLKLHRQVMEIDDGMVLQMILDFARAGWLNRLRRCLRCHRWLYARFRHQNYCSTKCQQQHYRHSDEWRTKRREYMQWYRSI